jgi:hypothetical protein
MIINSGSPAYLAALTRSTQRTQQPAGASADPQAAAQDAGSTTSQTGTPQTGGSQTGAAPLSGLHILSGIKTTLPNGLTLGMFRFDLGTSGLDTSNAGSGTDTSPATPTPEDQRADEAMLKAFMQMAHDFNDNPGASDIQLEGTAAVDLKGDLKA